MMTFFQQDGAPPHHAVTVRKFLDEQLPNRWIGRRGPVEWPPRSPDITPMDFFFWGVVKDKVFSPKPRIVDDMIHCIREAGQEIESLSLKPRLIHFRQLLFAVQQNQGDKQQSNTPQTVHKFL